MKIGLNKRVNYVDLVDKKFGNPGKIKIIKVFLVEDDEDLRLLYERILASFGFKVVEFAANGKEAVEKYKSLSLKPDVTIMDYQMPLKNGIEAGKEIIKHNPKAKILILSADRNIKEKVLSNNMNFLDKAFNIKELLNKLQELL